MRFERARVQETILLLLLPTTTSSTTITSKLYYYYFYYTTTTTSSTTTTVSITTTTTTATKLLLLLGFNFLASKFKPVRCSWAYSSKWLTSSLTCPGREVCSRKSKLHRPPRQLSNPHPTATSGQSPWKRWPAPCKSEVGRAEGPYP